MQNRHAYSTRTLDHSLMENRLFLKQQPLPKQHVYPIVGHLQELLSILYVHQVNTFQCTGRQHSSTVYLPQHLLIYQSLIPCYQKKEYVLQHSVSPVLVILYLVQSIRSKLNASVSIQQLTIQPQALPHMLLQRPLLTFQLLSFQVYRYQYNHQHQHQLQMQMITFLYQILLLSYYQLLQMLFSMQHFQLQQSHFYLLYFFQRI